MGRNMRYAWIGVALVGALKTFPTPKHLMPPGQLNNVVGLHNLAGLDSLAICRRLPSCSVCGGQPDRILSDPPQGEGRTASTPWQM